MILDTLTRLEIKYTLSHTPLHVFLVKKIISKKYLSFCAIKILHLIKNENYNEDHN